MLWFGAKLISQLKICPLCWLVGAPNQADKKFAQQTDQWVFGSLEAKLDSALPVCL